jgi:peptide-methionine (R)-S-oxide reductase
LGVDEEVPMTTNPENDLPTTDVPATDEEWRQRLTPEQYAVARLGGTERAFTGEYWDCHDDGTYTCACCGAPLFSSESKFDSGTGWPSFSRPVDTAPVGELADHSHQMVRTHQLGVAAPRAGRRGDRLRRLSTASVGAIPDARRHASAPTRTGGERYRPVYTLCGDADVTLPLASDALEGA